MSFDKTDTGPPVNVHKRTTKVNFWMAGLVAIFLAGGVAIMIWAHSHSTQLTESVHQQATKP